MDGVLMTLAQAATEAKTTSLLDYIRYGGITGYTIILLSVAAVAFWIFLAMELRMEKLAPTADVDALSKYFREGRVDEAVRYCESPGNQSFLTRLFAQAIKRCARSQFGLLELRSALEEGGQREVERLYRHTDWVALFAAVGPMLGLLGTVFGMIGAFNSISALEGAARSKELSGFMSLALVTTAMGLLVAIPCTAVYSISRRRIDRLAEQVADVADGLAGELLARANAQGRAAPRAQAGRAPHAPAGVPQAGAGGGPAASGVPVVPGVPTT